jgi:replicative superfamily II helicase
MPDIPTNASRPMEATNLAQPVKKRPTLASLQENNKQLAIELDNAQKALSQTQAENKRLRESLNAFRTFHHAALDSIGRHLGNVQETISILQFKGDDV